MKNQRSYYNARVQIASSAPTRIDLAGGTLDIWPLYLYHDGAQTLNAAITLRARCTISARHDGRLCLRSLDTGRSTEVAHWSELKDTPAFQLVGRILQFFQAESLNLTTQSDSPIGAGIAGSSALNIAVCAAMARWKGVSYSADELLAIAMNVEGPGDPSAHWCPGLSLRLLRRYLGDRAGRQRRSPCRTSMSIPSSSSVVSCWPTLAPLVIREPTTET